MKHLSFCLVASAWLAGPALPFAQGPCEPTWVPTFGGIPGTDHFVETLAVFDDGSGPAIFAGGLFDVAGGARSEGIAKWDGEAWSSLAGGVSGSVDALAVFDDGSGPALYVGGSFVLGEGPVATRVAKWDGTSWSGLGSGTSGGVRALAVFDDGSGPALYAAGEFLTAGGVTVNRVAKWDGTSWSALGDGLGVSAAVFALAVHDDGSGPALFAAGSFESAGGATVNRIAKWDGTSWSGLAGGVSTFNSVNALAVFDDGGGPALYAGGSFQAIGGVSASRIAKWDGASWSALGSGLSSSVECLAVSDDGAALYVGGSFATAGGVAASRLARWDGTSWSGLGSGLNGDATALLEHDDGSGSTLYVGGHFVVAGGLSALHVARWSDTTWSALGEGIDDLVRALAGFDDGGGLELYAGGDFTAVGGVQASRIAKWDGAQWSPLGSGTNGSVNALAVFDDGGGQALYAGGSFTTAGGVSASRIAKWNGTSWSALSSQVNGTVHALAVYDDGSGAALFAAGSFTTAGGASALRVAKWNGTSWSALGGGLGSLPGALAVYDDGGGPALYVGGSFPQIAGIPGSGGIARWDGVSWSAVGIGQDRVDTLVVGDLGAGSRLFAGGRVSLAGGNPTRGIVQWDGLAWSAPWDGVSMPTSGPYPDCSAVGIFDDGSGPKLYVSGNFQMAGATPANKFARWDGTAWSALGDGVQSGALAFLAHDDGSGHSLFVGARSLDSGDSFLARLAGCPDSVAPTISYPSSVLVIEGLRGPPGETVTFAVTADDNLDPEPAVVCTPPSGSYFPPGLTVVSCTATDAEGNQSVAEFTVEVRSRRRSRGQ